uniref:Phosphofurin acidic cluster sorting protein 1/2 C-terminal domain-containing protein n=1 Tax=Timema bartmani TaxID=61472 RepID=A0A7R9F1G9_9NEOP|nr:unnamed protein product [Timema bartmani]
MPEGTERERKTRLFARDRTTSSAKIKKQAEKSLSLETRSAAMTPSPVQGDISFAEPRKVVMEQLCRVLPPDDTIPDHLTLVNCADPQGSLLASKLQERQQKVVGTLGPADIRAAVICSNNFLARYLASVDGVYGAAFSVDLWKELLERAEVQKTDCQEMLNRVHRYLHGASATLQLPIAEAMITYKEKSSDDESSQAFVPFISDVRLGSPDTPASASVDLDESKESIVPLLSGSPPSLGGISEKKERITPPSSPNINSFYLGQATREPQSLSEPLELQLDYWQGLAKPDKGYKVDSTKSTLKTTFRSLQVQRLPLTGEQPTQHFLMSYSTKEKKQKIMRLGKKKEKEKEMEPKSQVVDGVSRLICSAKTHSIPLKVCIDGTEWSGVKFFQLSAQWQTHIKHFPVALFSFPETGL